MNAQEAAEAERRAQEQRIALAPAITIEKQIACVKREIAMRQRVYPRWVESGRMKQEAADREIAAMQAVLATLVALPPTQGALHL